MGGNAFEIVAVRMASVRLGVRGTLISFVAFRTDNYDGSMRSDGFTKWEKLLDPCRSSAVCSIVVVEGRGREGARLPRVAGSGTMDNVRAFVDVEFFQSNRLVVVRERPSFSADAHPELPPDAYVAPTKFAHLSEQTNLQRIT